MQEYTKIPQNRARTRLFPLFHTAFVQSGQQAWKHALRITGPVALKPTEFTVPDLRAGATILIAGLIADGVSLIHDTESHVERGYEEITERLNSMGASIAKV